MCKGLGVNQTLEPMWHEEHVLSIPNAIQITVVVPLKIGFQKLLMYNLVLIHFESPCTIDCVYLLSCNPLHVRYGQRSYNFRKRWIRKSKIKWPHLFKGLIIEGNLAFCSLWHSAGKELSSYETHQEMDYDNFLSLGIPGTVNFACLRSCRVRSRPLVWIWTRYLKAFPEQSGHVYFHLLYVTTDAMPFFKSINFFDTIINYFIGTFLWPYKLLKIETIFYSPSSFPYALLSTEYIVSS